MDAIQRQLTDLLNLLTRGQPFGWNNAVDVLIVAVFVYYVLVLIRGTRAVQLLIGVLVLVVVYGIAILLRLTLTTILLQALFALALVAIPVVFQPELRRALRQLGQLGPLNRLLVPGRAPENVGLGGAVGRAAQLVREAQLGGPFLVQRATRLHEYSE